MCTEANWFLKPSGNLCRPPLAAAWASEEPRHCMSLHRWARKSTKGHKACERQSREQDILTRHILQRGWLFAILAGFVVQAFVAFLRSLHSDPAALEYSQRISKTDSKLYVWLKTMLEIYCQRYAWIWLKWILQLLQYYWMFSFNGLILQLKETLMAMFWLEHWGCHCLLGIILCTGSLEYANLQAESPFALGGGGALEVLPLPLQSAVPSAAIRELKKRWCKSVSSMSWCLCQHRRCLTGLPALLMRDKPSMDHFRFGIRWISEVFIWGFESSFNLICACCIWLHQLWHVSGLSLAFLSASVSLGGWTSCWRSITHELGYVCHVSPLNLNMNHRMSLFHFHALMSTAWADSMGQQRRTHACHRHDQLVFCTWCTHQNIKTISLSMRSYTRDLHHAECILWNWVIYWYHFIGPRTAKECFQDERRKLKSLDRWWLVLF